LFIKVAKWFFLKPCFGDESILVTDVNEVAGGGFGEAVPSGDGVANGEKNSRGR